MDKIDYIALLDGVKRLKDYGSSDLLPVIAMFFLLFIVVVLSASIAVIIYESTLNMMYVCIDIAITLLIIAVIIFLNSSSFKKELMDKDIKELLYKSGVDTISNLDYNIKYLETSYSILVSEFEAFNKGEPPTKEEYINGVLNSFYNKADSVDEDYDYDKIKSNLKKSGR
jgi:hypothetical protein